jgi:hypothetical protein
MKQDGLKVVVNFPAAPEPFKDDNASREETLGSLKTRVLAFFGLTEGQGAGGSTTTYTFFDHNTALENLSVTLGQLAGDKDHLHLKLAQQITQG